MALESTTTSWADDELATIGSAEELGLASLRGDGTLRSYVTMWVVRAGDDLYVRSARGPAGHPAPAAPYRRGTTFMTTVPHRAARHGDGRACGEQIEVHPYFAQREAQDFG